MRTFHVEIPASCFNKSPCIFSAKHMQTGLCSVGINYLPFTYTIPMYLHAYPLYMYPYRNCWWNMWVGLIMSPAFFSLPKNGTSQNPRSTRIHQSLSPTYLYTQILLPGLKPLLPGNRLRCDIRSFPQCG